MLIDSFLTYIRCELNFSDCTVSSYHSDIAQWYAFAASASLAGCDIHTAEPDPARVTLDDLRQWVAYLSSEGIGVASIRRKIQAVRAFYKYLLKRGLCSVNPAADLRPAKLPRRLPVCIRPDEIASVLDDDVDYSDFVDFRDRLIIYMFYATGMRVSELINLCDDAVDCSRCELKVLGKRNKERVIPFGGSLPTMIEHYRILRDKQTGQTASATFFVRPDGRPLSRVMAYNIVRKKLDGHVAAKKHSPHVLRHSCATDLLNNGADITAVCQLLGHQSLATTQIYTHLSYRELLNNYKLAHPRALKSGG